MKVLRTGLRDNEHTTPMSSAPQQPAEDALYLDWLRRCLPVVRQPAVDVGNGHPLAHVFTKFRYDGSHGLCAEVSMVYDGEATYTTCCARKNTPRVATLPTFMYRSWNRFAYGRTADINSIVFLNIDLADPVKPWRAIWSFDDSGEQTFTEGDGTHCCGWFTVMKHRVRETPLEAWNLLQGTTRPIVFVNTSNHMMAHRDANPHLEKMEWKA